MATMLPTYLNSFGVLFLLLGIIFLLIVTKSAFSENIKYKNTLLLTTVFFLLAVVLLFAGNIVGYQVNYKRVMKGL